MGAFDGSNVLKGKVAIVTGGARGIGEGMTTAMAKAGASVAFTDIKEDLAKETEKKLQAQGLKVISIIADGRDEAQVKAAVKRTKDEFGSVWMVINNANVYQDQEPLEVTTFEKLNDMFDAGFYASWGLPGNMGYAANKEAIRALTRNAAREWGKYNITSNTIIPGAATPGMLKYFADNPEHAEKRKREQILGRFGIPEDDLGALAVFLCSDGARFLTGETIKMNGGINTNAL
jgi:NAD(P)-dependent dehydrogenase (short-subunit alcohol dehydrogenase family)